MTKQEAEKKVQELTSLAMQLIKESEKLADEHGFSFEFSVEYGMGGSYVGGEEKDEYGDGIHGWMPSSHSC